MTWFRPYRPRKVRSVNNLPVDLSHVTKGGNTWLHKNIDNLEVVETLLKRGVDTNARNNHFQTSVHIAAQHGTPEIITLLHECNGNIDAADEHYQTPLHVAVMANKLDNMRTLLEFGANPNAEASIPYEYTKGAYIGLVGWLFIPIVGWLTLLDHVVFNPASLSRCKIRPLHLAQNIEQVELLLAFGANPLHEVWGASVDGVTVRTEYSPYQGRSIMPLDLAKNVDWAIALMKAGARPKYKMAEDYTGEDLRKIMPFVHPNSVIDTLPMRSPEDIEIILSGPEKASAYSLNCSIVRWCHYRRITKEQLLAMLRNGAKWTYKICCYMGFNMLVELADEIPINVWQEIYDNNVWNNKPKLVELAISNGAVPRERDLVHMPKLGLVKKKKKKLDEKYLEKLTFRQLKKIELVKMRWLLHEARALPVDESVVGWCCQLDNRSFKRLLRFY